MSTVDATMHEFYVCIIFFCLMPLIPINLIIIQKKHSRVYQSDALGFLRLYAEISVAAAFFRKVGGKGANDSPLSLNLSDFSLTV